MVSPANSSLTIYVMLLGSLPCQWYFLPFTSYSALPCDFKFLMIHEGVLFFRLFIIFFSCEDENDHLESSFHIRTETIHSLLLLCIFPCDTTPFSLTGFTASNNVGSFQVFLLWPMHLKILSYRDLCIWILLPYKNSLPWIPVCHPKGILMDYLLFYHSPYVEG